MSRVCDHTSTRSQCSDHQSQQINAKLAPCSWPRLQAQSASLPRLHPRHPTLRAHSPSPHTTGVYFSGLYAGFSLALGAGTFVDNRLGWKWAYVLAALGGIAVAALAFLTVPEPEPQKTLLHRLGSPGSIPSTAAAVCAQTAAATESEWSPARDGPRRTEASLLGHREGGASSPAGREVTTGNGDAAGDGPRRGGPEGAAEGCEKPGGRRGGGSADSDWEWRRSPSAGSSGEET